MRIITTVIFLSKVMFVASAQDVDLPVFKNPEPGEVYPVMEGDYQEKIYEQMNEQSIRLLASIRDSRVSFLEDEKNLRKIARITKKYYDELRKAGFSDQQAYCSNGYYSLRSLHPSYILDVGWLELRWLLIFIGMNINFS